jgi:uncharacterized protein (TIGR03067 family)
MGSVARLGRVLVMVACSASVSIFAASGLRASGQAPKDDPRAAEDLKKMQGLWHALFVRRDDRADPAVSLNIRVLVKGDTITFGPDSILKTTGQIQLFPAESPGEMRLKMNGGLYKGQTVLTSYELKSESMNFKFRIATYNGPRATRERPKEIKPGPDAGFETLELVREERLDPSIMEGRPASKKGLFAPRPDTITPALRYFDMLYEKRLTSLEDFVAVPFVHNDVVLKDTPSVEAAHQAILKQFGDLTKGFPSIRDYQTYATARDAIAPALRPKLDAVLTKADILLLVCEPEGSKDKAENYVIVQVMNRENKPRIVGVVKKTAAQGEK